MGISIGSGIGGSGIGSSGIGGSSISGSSFSPLDLFSFSATKKLIDDDAGDVRILVVGDSTGDASDEWPRLLADWLATEYTTHSVDFYQWNDATPAYNSAVSISTGSGSNKIEFYNGSVPGSRPVYLMGAKFSAAIVTPNPHLVIWNHGHNSAIASTFPSLLRGEFLDGMENVRLALPNAYHAAIRQNPWRDDNSMAPVVAALDVLSSDYGDLSTIDVYSRFISAGKPSAWYLDNVHPNAAGQAQILNLITDQWRAAPSISVASPSAAFISGTASNYLTDAVWSDGYAGGLPTGWSSAGVSVAAEAVIVDSGATTSMKVESTGAGGFVFGSAPSAAGKTVTLAVRIFNSSGAINTGRISVYSSSPTEGNNTVTTRGYEGWDGGWCWRFISGLDVPADATAVRAYIYANNTSVGEIVYADRAVLVDGAFPRNQA